MLGAVLIGIVGGALTGFALSELIGIVGLLMFDRPIGLPYLPIVLGVAGGVLAGVVVQRQDRRDDRELR
ncbi:DUF5957 family protein [Pseudonocardia nigra]|uniref:DUF5957 family protein n=1 Tax=Pseudonocardia nigra TaxID=1921578 RepID=UPI001FE53960|nr:DUF5957 family protein [Pseudonocardia nigra]